MLKMYGEFASWWPLLSSPKDYEEEADFFIGLLQYAHLPQGATMLELGSGGGSNALYLKDHFSQTTLTDLSAEMLAVSRALNPDCEHLEGDMRTLRLNRTFDFVFVHDAIEYMTKHWDALTLFLRVPGAPLDNNLCERVLKKAILHRKTAMFYKTLNGARVGDLFMSIIHTAELAKIDVFGYLVAHQRHQHRVADDPASWMPWNYTRALNEITGHAAPTQ